MAGRSLVLLVLLGTVLSPHRPAAAAAPQPTLRQVASSLVAADAVVVVANARSGEELFAGGFADDALPPGSVFKLVVALAAGYEHPTALDSPRFCPPKASHEAPGPEGHGWIGLEDALAHSCNRYFAQLGGELGTAPLWRTVGRLAPGWPKTRPPAIPANELALGTGIRMTAHQQVALLRTVATDWISAGQEAPPAGTLRRIRDGLCRSVSEGTARAVVSNRAATQTLGPNAYGHYGTPDFAICGKTGTSLQSGSTLGWFSGYAPSAEPEVIIIVGLRNKLGRDAARAARDLFLAYFAHR